MNTVLILSPDFCILFSPFKRSRLRVEREVRFVARDAAEQKRLVEELGEAVNDE